MAIADTARLVASLELQDKFSRPAGQITGSLTRMEGNFSRIGRGAGQVAGGLARLGTVAAVGAAAGITAVVRASASFEQAFTGIEKTVDATDEQFAELNEQFREMARTIPVSFEELSAIGAAGGALGIARQDLLDFTDVVARLAVSTNLSSDQAATALGQLGNVLHLRGADFRDFADSLVALGNAGASTEDQIVEIAARFAAAGNSAGLSKEDILGLGSAVASMGIEVEAGGSALSRIFNNVTTNIGTSSDKAQAFADALGLSAAEFRTAWDRDALGTLEDFLGELNKLDQFAQAELLKDIGITNVRDVNTIRLLSQNVGLLGDQLEISRAAQGALNEESQKFFDTTAGQWQTLRNNIRDAGVTIGNELLPITKELTQEFTDFLNTPETRANLKAFGEDLARGIRNLVDELKSTDFSGIIDGMKLAATVAKGAFDAFRALPAPIQQLAIAALVANKVSGGAIGQIAKGLTNIAIGGGGLLGLGRTPATAMWVRQVGFVAGGAGAGLFGGGKGFLAGVGKVFGIAAGAAIAIELGKEIGNAIIGPQVQPQIERETDIFEQQLDAFRESPERLAHMETALVGSLHGIAGDTVDGLERFLIPGVSLLEAQIAEVRAAKEAAIANAETAREQRDLERDALTEAKGQRLAQVNTTDALKDLTLEQRLIRDKGFKAKIDSEEFLRILRKTSEFGKRGEGTAIEFGPKTGRDPLGDAFIALVKRLPKNQLTGEVYREVSNHIVALEEVQADLIREGKLAAARHAQANIDKLAALIGKVDQTRPALNRTAEKTQATATNTASFISKMESQLGISRDIAGTSRTTSRKDFSPNVDVKVTSNTSVSVNDVVRAVNSYEYAVSTFGNKIGNLP